MALLIVQLQGRNEIRRTETKEFGEQAWGELVGKDTEHAHVHVSC